MTQHTPWTADAYADVPDRWAVRDSRGELVSAVTGKERATLIAAAPETKAQHTALLEALEKTAAWLKFLPVGITGGLYSDDLKSDIAKINATLKAARP